jgi:hypothetical protein
MPSFTVPAKSHQRQALRQKFYNVGEADEGLVGKVVDSDRGLAGFDYRNRLNGFCPPIPAGMIVFTGQTGKQVNATID